MFVIGTPTGMCHIKLNRHNTERKNGQKIATRFYERRLSYVTVLGCSRTGGHLYQEMAMVVGQVITIILTQQRIIGGEEDVMSNGYWQVKMQSLLSRRGSLSQV
jgi:hypothetical protein